MTKKGRATQRGNAQSRATLFRHSAVLLGKVSNSKTPYTLGWTLVRMEDTYRSSDPLFLCSCAATVPLFVRTYCLSEETTR